MQSILPLFRIRNAHEITLTMMAQDFRQEQKDQLGGCPKIEAYCGKADLSHVFPLFEANSCAMLTKIRGKYGQIQLFRIRFSILGQPPGMFKLFHARSCKYDSLVSIFL